MEQLKNLTTQPQPESSEPTQNSSITEEHIANLWHCMIMYYGYNWLNSFGEADNGAWLTGLCDVTPAQILHGIDCCRKSEKEWPPTLPEFRRMCRSPVLTTDYNSKPLRETQKMLHAPQNEKLGAESLANIKQILKRKSS